MAYRFAASAITAASLSLLGACTTPAATTTPTPSAPTPAAPTTAAPQTGIINRGPYLEAVTELYGLLHPICPLRRDMDNMAIAAPAQALADQFRQGIAGSRYAPLYDQAMADAHHQRTLIAVRCAAPRDEAVDSIRARMVNETRSAIENLRAMSNTPR